MKLKTDYIISKGNEQNYSTEVVNFGLTNYCTDLHSKFDKYEILWCLEFEYQALLIAKYFFASDFLSDCIITFLIGNNRIRVS